MRTPKAPKKQPIHASNGVGCDMTRDEVAKAAFAIYHEKDCRDGDDVQNWLDAEALVKARHASVLPRSIGHRTGTVDQALV